MRIGILTGGGDVPGLNPCIKAVVRRAQEFGWEVVGFRCGWAGPLNFNPDDDAASRQEWLMSLDSVYSESTYFEAEDYPEELPAAIKKLEPQYMYFGKFDGEERSVELGWGGGFGDWGIRIGLPGMETLEEGVIELDGPISEFRRSVQPGVYVFSRG